MPAAGGFLDALPIIVIGVVFAVWLVVLAARKAFARGRARPGREAAPAAPKVSDAADARPAGTARRGLLHYDLEPILKAIFKRLFLWVFPTLRVEVATCVSLVGFYLLIESGGGAGVARFIAERFASGSYLGAALVILVLGVLAAGLVLPPLSLVMPQLRGRARGSVVLSSAVVVLASLGWSAVAYAGQSEAGATVFGVRLGLILCVVASIEFGLVGIGCLLLLGDGTLLGRLFPDPTVDMRLVWANAAVFAVLAAADRWTGALGPATVALASINLAVAMPGFMPEPAGEEWDPFRPDAPRGGEAPAEDTAAARDRRPPGRR